MVDQTREQRLQVMLTANELEALDTWRFKMRMPSRAAAIRELLRRGLSAEGFKVADASLKSSDFGVRDEDAAGGNSGGNGLGGTGKGNSRPRT